MEHSKYATHQCIRAACNRSCGVSSSESDPSPSPPSRQLFFPSLPPRVLLLLLFLRLPTWAGGGAAWRWSPPHQANGSGLNNRIRVRKLQSTGGSGPGMCHTELPAAADAFSEEPAADEMEAAAWSGS